MSAPDPPPDPSTFRGVKLRTYLESIYRWMLRDRVIAGIGVAIESTPAGRKISAGVGASGSSTGISLVKLPSGGIASGATGTVTYYTAWDTLGTDTVVIRNQFDTAAPSLKKCLIGYVAGVGLGIISWDCS